MSKKLLVVYNTCGISGKENTESYIKSLEYLLAQDFESFDVVFSSCLNHPDQRERVKNHFGNKLIYNFIDERHPVNVTFNHSVESTVKRRGEYEGYIYVDSGTSFIFPNLLSSMYEKLATGKYGMITPQPSTDTEYFGGLGIGRHRGDDDYAREIMFKDGDYLIPIGKGVATHTNLVSNELRAFYGRVYPDIFASHCTESTFSFLNAALKKQWILLKDFILPHEVSLDGQSSGFSPVMWRMRGGQLYDHPYRIDSILKRLVTIEAMECGFGYEECNKVLMHDASQFDSNYHCKNEKLKFFVKENLFLKPHELDYESIKSEYTD